MPAWVSVSSYQNWEVTRDRRDGKWIEGHGTEFPPLGHMSQPHESALFNRLDLGVSFRYTNGAWVQEGSAAASSPLTVQEVDGVPSAVSVDTIQFDQADGFVLTDLGAGDVRLDLAAVPEARLTLSFPTHSSANDPSAGQKAALAGTSGVPGVGNEYVTDDDPRNADARTPLAHTHPESDVTGLVADLAGKAAAVHTHAEADVTGLVADLSAKVPTTRTISTTAPLTGGGDLSANRTLAVSDATTADKGVVELATDGESAANVAVQGNDARMSNARTPTAHKTTHQDGGADEISVLGLSGLLADAQTPLAHQLDGAVHTVAGLTPGHVLRATGAATFAFGAIADADLPSTIARDTETAAAITAHEAAADPHTGYQRESEKAAASGYASLDAGTLVPVAQLPAGTTTAKGVVELATSGENAANVVVQGNDSRLSDYRTPTWARSFAVMGA